MGTSTAPVGITTIRRGAGAMVEIFAPGKLFIFGVWSVLFGGRALVASGDVGQEGRLTLAPCADTRPEFIYFSPEFAQKSRRWLYEGGVWCEVAPLAPGEMGAIDVVGEVVRVASAQIPRPSHDAVLKARARGLFREEGGGQKYGFGSSGAISALVSRSLWEAAGGRFSSQDVLKVAMEGHRRAQGGRGSGADVAASVVGGCFVFELPEPPGFGSSASGLPSLTPCAKPEGLSVLAVWSGQEADTRALMSAVSGHVASDPEGWAQRLSSVSASAERGVDAWLAGDVGEVMEAVTASHEALRAMGEGAGVSIVIEAHEAIRRCVVGAVGEGAAAVKPSGAGGGDMALAFVVDGSLGAVQRALEGEGYQWMPWM